ncbi:MAG TPA: YhjD/YihY/BrkB family envelope integrity protein [Candidatus Saccharimonadales bacterium]
MDRVTQTIKRLDRTQQKHRVLSFPYAVIKKYGDDNGSYQAALITYYGFLSLFPLLLVAVVVLQFLFHNENLRADILHNIANYFPVVGEQLQHNIHTTRVGLGLVVGLIIALYGARSGADALRYTLDHTWLTPHHKRAGFPKGMLRSFGVIGVGAFGLALSVVISGFSSLLGHTIWQTIIANVLGALGLTWVLLLAFRIASSKAVAYKDMFVGTFCGAVVMQLLLTFGGILVRHQLRSLGSLYGTFAIVLGLLFWLYLLAQVLVYAIEIDTVRTLRLWPRSITPELKTDGDRRAYDLYAKSARYMPDEKVFVEFDNQEHQRP